jgi:two-component system chemotaxis sensor kinase CheA
MTPSGYDIKARLMAIFQVEAQEHLQILTTNLLSLGQELPPADVLQLAEATFREVHTLKGAARSVGLTEVESLCQAMEAIFSRVTRGQLPLSKTVLNHVQEGIDGVATLLAGTDGGTRIQELTQRLEDMSIKAADTQPSPRSTPLPQPAAASPHPAPDTIRMATGKLDAVLLQAEDLLVPKLAAEERVRDIAALVSALSRCRVNIMPSRSREQTAQPDSRHAAPDLEKALRAAQAQARQLLEDLTHDQRVISGTVDGLLEEMRRIRMMPASTILDFFPRMVRDLAEQQGKDVEWVAQGGDLEVDRKVLDVIKDPLIQMVRNAIDHGIEPPNLRTEAGKPARGRLAVKFASLEGNRIEITVQDDGRGINRADVRAAAVRARQMNAETADSLTEEEALNLVFRSGLSTSPIITELSGHGLGLAIVKERMERLGGRIHLETAAGKGLTVRMILPASIATFHGLLIQTSGQRFLLPTDAVERVIRVQPEKIQYVEEREAIEWEGRPLFVASVSRLLDLTAHDAPVASTARVPCAIVRVGDERAGLLIEDILGDQEVLVKEFRPPLVRIRNVAGSGLLGTGQVVPILRPADLLASLRERHRAPRSAAGSKQSTRPLVILIVDDSITTRTMEKNLLEAAGYQVKVAVDGIDAWTLLKSEAVDLVVSDVDMPQMNGLDLTAKIRADQKLGELPVILVTALESREDKERGIEVGANAYVVKSSFDQSNLLEIIRRLI